MYMRNINSGWKSTGSSVVSLSTAVFTEDPLPEGTYSHYFCLHAVTCFSLSIGAEHLYDSIRPGNKYTYSSALCSAQTFSLSY